VQPATLISFVSFVSYRHKVFETCPQRQTRVYTHQFTVSTNKSTLPNDTVASPYRSSTCLFLCITAQWPLCPQWHFRYQQVQTALMPVYHCVPSDTLGTNRYKRLLRPYIIVSPATRYCLPSGTSGCMPIVTVYPATRQAVRVFLCCIVL